MKNPTRVTMQPDRVTVLDPTIKTLEQREQEKKKGKKREAAQAKGEFEVQAQGEGYFIIQRGVAPVESSGHS